MTSRDDRLEPEIEAADTRRGGWSRPRVAVVAAVVLGVLGATLWASGWGDPGTPAPAASGTSVVSTSPTPQVSTTALPTSSAPSGPMIPTTPASASTPARPELSTRSVLVAADYGTAGWPLDSVEAAEGWGQSPIATCEYAIPAPADTRPVVRGDGYRRGEGRVLAAYQWVIDAGTAQEAEGMVTTVLKWPDGCDSFDRVGTEDYVITSTPPERLTLPDGGVGYWYTTNIQNSRPDRVELVAVVRRGERVSLVVLHENDPAGSLDAVDAGALLKRSFERLG